MRSGILFILFCVPGFIISQVSFEATTDAESVLQGSTFQLTFKLKNAESSGFRAPNFEPFQIVSGPSRSMQTTIINGAMTSSMGFVYVLSCNQVGSFTIPPASVVVNGKSYQTRPVTIKVVKATATASSGADVFIKAIVEKPEVYYGEQFTLSYKLYTRVNLQNIEFASKPSLDAFQEEAVNINNPSVQREIYEGKEYTTKLLSKTVLFPVKTGMITIDPLAFRIVKGDNDPWGMGMPSMFRSQVENVVSNEIKLKVKELPQPKPNHFSGAVGEMYIQFSPVNKSYTLNDAIHLGIQIQGEANFNIIKSDFVHLDTSFEISDSKLSDIVKVTDTPKMTKTRKFDYLIVPKSVGDFIIKPDFIYFSPAQNKYVSLQDSFAIHITRGNASLANQDLKEIADIKRNFNMDYRSPTLLKDYRTWMLCCLPIGLLMFSFYKRNANKYFGSKHSKNNIDHLSMGEELSFEYIEKLIVQKMYSKYTLDFDNSTLAAAKQFLQQKKSSDEAAIKFLNIIQQLEAMKYSGGQSQELLNQLQDRISRL